MSVYKRHIDEIKAKAVDTRLLPLINISESKYEVVVTILGERFTIWYVFGGGRGGAYCASEFLQDLSTHIREKTLIVFVPPLCVKKAKEKYPALMMCSSIKHGDYGINISPYNAVGEKYLLELEPICQTIINIKRVLRCLPLPIADAVDYHLK